MAIVVEHKKTYERFILLGAGLGMFKATRPSIFGGNLIPHEDEGIESIIAVCNNEGNIHFIDKKLLKVVEVDSISLDQLQDCFKVDEKHENMTIYRCPACNERVSKDDTECCYCKQPFI